MIIAGAVGRRPPAYLKSLTDELLNEQNIYGAPSRTVTTAEAAALGAGHTPDLIANLAAGRDCLLCADTRLDNRDELRERVGGRPVRSDAELLLALWLKEGEDGLARISGDFALAVFDPRSGSLSLARDITGQRPLFYAKTDFGLAFSSMAAGLRPAFPDFQVNRQSLALIGLDLPMEREESFFEDVYTVPQAGIVTFAMSTGRIERKSYWTAPPVPADHGDRNALVKEYRHVLDQAVQARLGNGATIATHLSGGFDSSSVTATAVRLLGNPQAVIGFTSAPAFATPPEKEFGFFAEESELAGDVAARYGIRHVVVRETAPIPDVLHRQTVLLQQPVRDPFNGAWWAAIETRASAMGATRLLTGELGNLTINAGNITDLSEWIRRRKWATWFNQALAASHRPDVKWRGLLYSTFRPWIPNPVASTLERVFLGRRPSDAISFVRPEWQQSAEIDVPPNNYAARLAIIRGTDSASVRKAALAEYGIEECDPFSDRRLIEFAYRIPPDQYYWNGVQRPLMREALADRLPASLFNKFGRGLQSADWAVRLSKAEAFGLHEEIAASSVARDLLDIDRMRKSIERWPERNWNDASIAQEYRVALLDAIGVGMFAAAYG